MAVSRPRWLSAAVVGNATAMLSLVLIAAALLRWQPGSLSWVRSGDRVVAAAMVVLAYLVFCALLMLAQSRRRGRAAAAIAALQDSGSHTARRVLVAYASQTGTAERLALQTAATLRASSIPVRLVALSQLTAADLAGEHRALFVVATTGEGDPPDGLARFRREIMGAVLPLGHLQYGLLALGDRDYDHFCGFGHDLDQWLRHQGATTLFDLVEVDNIDEGALRHWQHHLGVLSGVTDLPDWSAPSYQSWRLAERRELNPGSPGDAVFHLSLQPLDGMSEWQAGDIAEIGPRNAPEQVGAVLDALDLDGFALAGAESDETLAMALSRSHLPADSAALEAWRGLTPVQLAAGLKGLPHREYSISSLASDGRLELLVRRMRQPDGRPGLGSGWLTRHAEVGGEIALRIRVNPGFHPPMSDRPLILIGNGTGLSGLRAQLKARAAAGHRRNWLLFGERTAAHDFFYRDEILALEAAGVIERLDLAFSRDQPERIYVQDRLRQAVPILREWVAAGAAIYVCGSLQGMAPAVAAVLEEALGAEHLERMAEQGLYRRDVY